MWWTEEGDRVLTDAEWDVFNTGLDLLLDLVESDVGSDESDLAVIGVAAFDDLTAEQKLALLADVAEALRYPGVPSPELNAANEAAVVAVLETFKDMLMSEIETSLSEPGERRTDLRRSLLKAIGPLEDVEEPLPSENESDPEEWAFLMEILEGRIFWDNDFALANEFLDLPPEDAQAQLDLHGIDPDYYLSIPPDPNQAELRDVRKRLARVQGHPEPSD